MSNDYHTPPPGSAPATLAEFREQFRDLRESIRRDREHAKKTRRRNALSDITRKQSLH